MRVSKKLASLLAMCAFLGAMSVPVTASAVPPKFKCNSGNGNLSETDPSNDCDPGNSAGHNSGGD